jgi:hypothetical protein
VDFDVKEVSSFAPGESPVRDPFRALGSRTRVGANQPYALNVPGWRFENLDLAIAREGIVVIEASPNEGRVECERIPFRVERGGEVIADLAPGILVQFPIVER